MNELGIDQFSLHERAALKLVFDSFEIGDLNKLKPRDELCVRNLMSGSRIGDNKVTIVHLMVRMGFESFAEFDFDQSNFIAIFDFFISNGIEKRVLDFVDSNNKTALMIASERGNLDLASVLVKNGADLDLQDLNGNTCLHLCSKTGNSQIAELLLDNGADFSFTNHLGESAWHLAQLNGLGDIYNKIECLISSNPNRVLNKAIDSIANFFGVSHSNSEEIMDYKTFLTIQDVYHEYNEDSTGIGVEILLEKLCFEYDTSVLLRQFLFMMHNNAWLYSNASELYKIMMWVVDNCDDSVLDTRDSVGGKSLMHLAVSLEDLELLEQLIERGAYIHIRDSQGNTPLHTAAQGKNPEVVKVLIRAGADVDLHNNAGDSADFYGKANRSDLMKSTFINKLYINNSDHEAESDDEIDPDDIFYEIGDNIEEEPLPVSQADDLSVEDEIKAALKGLDEIGKTSSVGDPAQEDLEERMIDPKHEEEQVRKQIQIHYDDSVDSEEAEGGVYDDILSNPLDQLEKDDFGGEVGGAVIE